MAERVTDDDSSRDRGGLIRAAVAATVFVIAFSLYLKTLAPTVGPTDSGELTLAAWCLGNAHPPGFPLFLLLTNLFTHLPLGSIAVRANIASAFFSAIACACVALAAAEILLVQREVRPAAREETKREKKRREKAQQTAAAPVVVRPPSRGVIALVMLATGLLFAFSRTLWQYAVVTEVYAVNSALMTATAWLMLRWSRLRRQSGVGDGGSERVLRNAARDAPQPRPPDSRLPDRWLYAAALLFGLGLCVHHVTTATASVGIAVLITRVAGAAFWRSRTLVIAAILLACGLLVYVYLPIAASHHPVMNWSNPNSASRVWDQITGKQYQTYLTDQASSSQLARYAGIVGRELGPSWLPLVLLVAAFGVVMLFRQKRTIFWYVVLFMAADLAWFAIYPIGEDQSAYAIPTIVALLLAFAYGAAALVDRAADERGRWIAGAAMLVLPVLSLATTYRIHDRSRFLVSHDYAENALRSMRTNGLLLTGHWQLYAPMRYVLDVDHERRDIEVIETGLLLRRWYFENLRDCYPRVLTDSRREVDALLPLLDTFADDPRSIDHVEFNRRIDDLLLSFVGQHLRLGPVYMSVDIAASQDPRDVNLIKRLTAAYGIVPRGMVVELVPGHAFRDVRYMPLVTRGLNDGTVAYEDDDVVPTQIVPAYRAMFMMTGRYLAIENKLAESLNAYRQAARIAPGNSQVDHEMRAVESRLGR